VVAVLAIAVIAMFYRNTKQKRHYEKLLFAAKKEELAYINSHDIRRHLTNILGIIDVVQHSEHKEKEYLQAEEYLFRSAEELDRAIKNISEKLDN
jgi:signal transduction histidine kinase